MVKQLKAMLALLGVLSSTTQPSVTPVPGTPTPSSGLFRQGMRVVGIQACRQNTHTHKIQAKVKERQIMVKNTACPSRGPEISSHDHMVTSSHPYWNMTSSFGMQVYMKIEHSNR